MQTSEKISFMHVAFAKSCEMNGDAPNLKGMTVKWMIVALILHYSFVLTLTVQLGLRFLSLLFWYLI